MSAPAVSVPNVALSAERLASNGPSGTGWINGVHHLSLATTDLKQQLLFYCHVLGAELVALYRVEGVEEGMHGFVRLSDSSYLAFMQSPENSAADTVLGQTHARGPAGSSAGGTLQHLAFNVPDVEHLLAMRDRIRSYGVQVLGPVDHGFCQSIYLAGPENVSLEIATSAKPIDHRAWIDPAVVGFYGIDPDELASMREPASFTSLGGGVVQPTTERGGEDVQRIMMMSDADVWEKLSTPKPPVEARA